mmetsp:Transcript_37405/g.110441  ORF Transcript_37405/g.110441 Transcript_37405/m.110441 type:complete len:239 (-) Transcript_37405:1541-2257(-)
MDAACASRRAGGRAPLADGLRGGRCVVHGGAARAARCAVGHAARQAVAGAAPAGRYPRECAGGGAGLRRDGVRVPRHAVKAEARGAHADAARSGKLSWQASGLRPAHEHGGWGRAGRAAEEGSGSRGASQRVLSGAPRQAVLRESWCCVSCAPCAQLAIAATLPELSALESVSSVVQERAKTALTLHEALTTAAECSCSGLGRSRRDKTTLGPLSERRALVQAMAMVVRLAGSASSKE